MGAGEDNWKSIEREFDYLRLQIKTVPPAERDAYVANCLATLRKLTDEIREGRVKGVSTPTRRTRVASDDPTTVPGVIRGLLREHETNGLSTRQLVAMVAELRPQTTPGTVNSSLHSMRGRGEIHREGFHKNYVYRMTPTAPTKLVAVNGGGGSR